MTLLGTNRRRALGSGFVVVLAAVTALVAGLLTPVTPATAVVADSTAATQVATDLSATDVSGASAVATDIAQMADLSLFRPGNIISDAVFFNKNTMTESQIQAFLQTQVPSCRSGYTCLKDWYDTSRTTSADAMCGAYSGGVRERASRIIYKVAQACGINPQVILATLQKEQGLVTHVWPSTWRYTIAMGQGCPDTAACDTRYYGFFNQVFGAAWQFKRYANPPGTSQYFTWYAPGKTWNVRWHPNASCGSSPVYIENQATANLYYYTPYQPNAAAIRAYSGTGDACSSYGNRNFYRYFVDWFGSTHGNSAASRCAAPYGASSAFKTYVLLSEQTARKAPRTTCADGGVSLDAGTVVQATSVTADKNWIQVHVDAVDRWVPRDQVRYASATESVCAMPSAASARKTYVVSVATVTARVAPTSACDAGSAEVREGTVATAIAVSSDRDWLKLAFAEGHRWIPRSDVRYASSDESACTLPVDFGDAVKTYTVRPGGLTARVAPSVECTDVLQARAGETFTAAAVTEAGDWLMFWTDDGRAMWAPRSAVEYSSRMDVCDLGAAVRSASKTYVVSARSVVGRLSPSAGCGEGSVEVSSGVVATAVAVTAERDWLKLAFAGGQLWVPRDAVRYASAGESVCTLPTDFRSAFKSYVVLPGGSTARSAPTVECGAGVRDLPAGTGLTAMGVTADGDWLMFQAADGADLWLPRDTVDYASRVGVCDLGGSVRSAYRTYVVSGEGAVGRLSPSVGCADGAVEVSSGVVATAVAVTAERDWLKLAFAGGQLWVPRDAVRYASAGESVCTLPTDFRSAFKSYVVLPGGSTARSAPTVECGAGVRDLPAGTGLTAMGVTADGDWLMFQAADGADLWLPRDTVDYR
ncbi:hypothetical protein ACFQZV_12465 [Microbacterium koreense]|uniref:SH3 domain-containing protein n=1 Tax=Microbacterium koreense TaxID=323761 RepID=A0ABW2ZTV2_9MICO